MLIKTALEDCYLLRQFLYSLLFNSKIVKENKSEYIKQIIKS